MRTVIDISKYYDNAILYSHLVKSQMTEKNLVSAAEVNDYVMTVDHLEDTVVKVLNTPWDDIVKPDKGVMFYQEVSVDDSQGTCKMLFLLDHDLNRHILQIETGDGWDTNVNIGYSGVSDAFNEWLIRLDIPSDKLDHNYDIPGPLANSLMHLNPKCAVYIEQYEQGTKEPLVKRVRMALTKAPHNRNGNEKYLCRWYKDNSPNGAALVQHADDLHARIEQVLDKL